MRGDAGYDGMLTGELLQSSGCSNFITKYILAKLRSSSLSGTCDLCRVWQLYLGPLAFVLPKIFKELFGFQIF